jgi:hypothetical protein
MASGDLSIRIAVGTAHGRHSVVWSVFTTNNEMYAAHRTWAGIEKLSFHSSDLCLRAFIKPHQLPPTVQSRVFNKWTKAKTPPRGQGRVPVLTVLFPEGHLSPDLQSTSKRAIWLPPPKPGHARSAQLLFTREREDDFRRLVADAGDLFVAYHSLPNGEAVAIHSLVDEFEQPDLIVEASHGAPRDLVLPSQFEGDFKRPVGFTTYSQAGDDEMLCLEASGYWVTSGDARRLFPMAASFSRSVIIERRGNPGAPP